MLSKIHGYHNREVRDFLLHDHLWCLAKPRCIVKHELSRIQKLSRCVSKSSLQSFFISKRLRTLHLESSREKVDLYLDLI